MKAKIEACFNRLQGLDIKPTKSNMEILLQTLYDLQEVFNKMRDGDDDGGQTADPE